MMLAGNKKGYTYPYVPVYYKHFLHILNLQYENNGTAAAGMAAGYFQYGKA
jgi:hypothetical protein